MLVIALLKKDRKGNSVMFKQRRVDTIVAGVTALTASLGQAAIAAEPVLEASSIVNTYLESKQQSPRIAKDSNGNFVVVWQSWLQDGSSWGIYAQRYSREGVPMGSEISVNSTTAGEQSLPDVAMDAQGNFIVTWQSAPSGTQNYGIYARRFDLTGSPMGSEFQVNTCRTGGQQFPAVAMDSDGDAVIVWDSTDSSRLCAQERFTIRGQRYSASGALAGSEFRVNTVEKSQGAQDVALPDVAMSSTGAFVVTWQYLQSTTWDIFAKRYSASGVAQGAQFRANTFTSNLQLEPKIAMDAAGNFMIAWRSEKQNGSTAWDIYSQRYNANGSKRGNEFKANTNVFSASSGTYTYPYFRFSISASALGRTAVVWECPQTTPAQICAQNYDVSGNPSSSWFYVRSDRSSNTPAVANDDIGYTSVAWRGWIAASSEDVYFSNYR